MENLKTYWSDITPESKKAVGFALAALITYAVTFGIVRTIIENGSLTGPVAIALTLVPIVPFVVALYGVVGIYRAADEMLRKIHVQGLMYAFIIMLAIGVPYSQLEQIDVVPHVHAIFVVIVLELGYIIGAASASARYGDQ